MFEVWNIPNPVMLSNYIEIFRRFKLAEMFLNSLMLVAVQPLAGLFSTCCAAYAIAKFRFRLRGFMYGLALSVMFIPTVGSLAATYGLMHDLGLIDTYTGMIIMSLGGFGFNFMLMHAVFRGISWTYAEAAYIDGAGYWRVFIQIMLPHAGATIAAIWVLSIIGTWNDYTGPLIFYPSHPTVSTGIKKLSDDIVYNLDYPGLFAAIVITTLPIVVLFISCQKYIIRINMGGGIKE
jgi:raffinose/stachyose/melibiose transport system permease protein/N-acetylglucosamine transport system permease protein